MENRLPLLAVCFSCSGLRYGAAFLPALLSPRGEKPQDHRRDSEAYIENKGSDTIVNLALAWAEKYQQIHPEVRISVTGGGSGTGIASLINKTVDIANASRQITAEEVKEAQKQGVDPLEHVSGRDAIAVMLIQ